MTIDKVQVLKSVDSIRSLQELFADTEDAFPPKHGTHLYECVATRIQDFWKSARFSANEPEAEIDVSIDDYSLRLIPKNEAAERVLTLYEEYCVRTLSAAS